MMWKSNLSQSNLICRKWREKHYKTECLEVHCNYLHVQTPLSRFRHTVNNKSNNNSMSLYRDIYSKELEALGNHSLIKPQNVHGELQRYYPLSSFSAKKLQSNENGGKQVSGGTQHPGVRNKSHRKQRRRASSYVTPNYDLAHSVLCSISSLSCML